MGLRISNLDCFMLCCPPSSPRPPPPHTDFLSPLPPHYNFNPGTLLNRTRDGSQEDLAITKMSAVCARRPEFESLVPHKKARHVDAHLLSQFQVSGA